jgi:hypothetical protein
LWIVPILEVRTLEIGTLEIGTLKIRAIDGGQGSSAPTLKSVDFQELVLPDQAGNTRGCNGKAILGVRNLEA